MLIPTFTLVWPQHLTTGEQGGRCTNDNWEIPGSNWAGGNKKGTQDKCQQECASDSDCKFYCYGKDKSLKTYSCLRYKACPELATKSHTNGKDMSSYTCYMKPGEKIIFNLFIMANLTIIFTYIQNR